MGLVERLKSRKRFVKKIPLRFGPGSDEEPFYVGLLALTDREEAAAQDAVEEFFAPKKQEEVDKEKWDSERAVQILARAIVDSEVRPPTPCLSVDEVRDWFVSQELGYLLQEYYAHLDAVTLHFHSLSEEQYQAIVEEVKKNPEMATSFGWHMLVGCTRFMAKELSNSRTKSSSTISP